jgi:hypothetical protein
MLSLPLLHAGTTRLQLEWDDEKSFMFVEAFATLSKRFQDLVDNVSWSIPLKELRQGCQEFGFVVVYSNKNQSAFATLSKRFQDLVDNVSWLTPRSNEDKDAKNLGSSMSVRIRISFVLLFEGLPRPPS